MVTRAFVLFSGGMDSTVCLKKAISEHGASNVQALLVDYGQRHIKELHFAVEQCGACGVQHTVMDLQHVLGGAGVMLTDSATKIPNISYSDIKGVSPTFVPFRNGTLLSAAAAAAQLWVKNETERLMFQFMRANRGLAIDRDNEQARKDTTALIYFGAHAEDAAGGAYPDCTPEFIAAMATAIHVASGGQVRLVAPLQFLSKREVVALGQKLGVCWEQTWSCYKGETYHCGVCPTCRARRDALAAEGVEDLTFYEGYA